MKGLLVYEQTEAIRNKWFVKELIKEAALHNIDLDLLYEEDLMNHNSHVQFAIYRGRDWRTSAAMEKLGLRLFNRSEVNKIANNKLKTNQLASILGIPCIPTKKLNPFENTCFPLILKTIDGHGGNEVFFCPDKNSVETIAKQYSDRQLLAQPFIEHNTTDVRIYVIGKKVIGAVKRTGVNSFKANVSLGGQAQPFNPPRPLIQFSEKIASALHSDYIGIDFIQNDEGLWLLNEIEDPVGARSLYETSDTPVAHLVMKHIRNELKEIV